MEQVKINSLELRNFKGIKSFKLEMNGENINVAGDNRTGKTTLAVAFTWLLWGKDLSDRKDYEIKTLDKNNKPIPQLEHEVNCVLEVNGTRHTLKRVYKEKWTKRRGEEQAELTGHETQFWWNKVPLKLKEYNQKVEKTFGSESTFKVLTNPFFFNINLKWEERRGILTDIVGEDNDMDILQSESRFSELVDKITGKTMEEYEAQIKSRKKEIKDTLEVIPARQDELDRMRPEMEPDYEQLALTIKDIENQNREIDEQISDKSKVLENYYGVRGGWLKNINDLKDKIREMKQAATDEAEKDANEKRKDAYALKRKVSDLEEWIKSAQISVDRDRVAAEELIKKQDNLRAKYTEESRKTIEIESDNFVCPTCKRPYDAEKAAEMEASMLKNFNEKQAAVLTDIQTEGKKLGDKIQEIADNNADRKKEIIVKTKELQTLSESLKEINSRPVSEKSAKDILSNSEEYKKVVERLESLQTDEPPKPTAGDTSELKTKKDHNNHILQDIQKKMNIKDLVNQLNDRSKGLESQEKILTQELSKLEKDEYLIEQFTKSKVDAIEGKVNKLFPSVNFKLFEIQLNGGLRETCQTLVDGVPYSAANNAAQIQSGIEIINVLQAHYGMTLPVFIDNAEAITSFPETEAQMVKLYVEKGIKSLTVK